MRKGLLLFALVALVQWAVPVWMVRGKERVLTEGTPYKFKLQPIDPSDPFRGEYVILNYEAFNAEMAPPLGLEDDMTTAYALLGTGSDGFARVVGLTLKEPASGDHVRVQVSSYARVDSLGRPEERSVSSVYPEFDRFYLEEGGGRVAEDLVRWRPDTAMIRDAYALVRVYAGDAAIEDLFISDRPIRQWVEEARAAADTATVAP